MTEKQAPPAVSASRHRSDARVERQAAALRANLARRKQKQRAGRADDAATGSQDANSEVPGPGTPTSPPR